MPRWILPLLILLLPLLGVAQAQTTNAICVVVFDDDNGNTIQDPGEIPLAGITVTVALENELIIRSHITTTEPRPHCFEGLADGNYILTFVESPNHRPMMQNTTALSLANGQPVQVKFAAIPQTPFEDQTVSSSTAQSTQLSLTSRLLLGGIGAIFSAMLMIGLGGVIGAILYR